MEVPPIGFLLIAPKPAHVCSKTSALSESLTRDQEDQMKYAEQQIMNEVIVHMGKYDGSYRDWYTGVAADAKVRLFNDHGVKEAGDAWICRQCVNEDAARQIERYFIKKGCKGGTFDEEQSTLTFYAYMIKPHTRQ
jgi:hypothetical protein